MKQQLFASQTPLSTRRNGKLVAPQLYLSSVEAGWEGLVAQAYHEPIELDGWIAPATPDISLILFRVERCIWRSGTPTGSGARSISTRAT